MAEKPFRWNITKRKELGGLLHGEIAYFYPDFIQDLLPCCAKVLANVGDSDVIFVGRSLENAFDHLSGLLYETSWMNRLTLLQFSNLFYDDDNFRPQWHQALRHLRKYFIAERLDPESLMRRRRPVAFVDLVCSGGTYGTLMGILRDWADEEKIEWKAVRRKIRLVGITSRNETSPDTWRWQQHAAWAGMMESGSIRNIAIDPQLWRYMGDWQSKLTRSYTARDWGTDRAQKPSRHPRNLEAVRLAALLFDLGRSKERIDELAHLLTRERAMQEQWLRDLVHELRRMKKGGRERSGSRSYPRRG